MQQQKPRREAGVRILRLEGSGRLRQKMEFTWSGRFPEDYRSLLLPLASLRIARHTGVQERRERVSDRFQDLSPGLGNITPEKSIAGVVFPSRKSAGRIAIQRAVWILQALAVSGNFAGECGIGAQAQNRSRAGCQAEMFHAHLCPPILKDLLTGS